LEFSELGISWCFSLIFRRVFSLYWVPHFDECFVFHIVFQNCCICVVDYVFVLVWLCGCILWTCEIVPVWCIIVSCGHVHCISVTNTCNNIDDTCFVHVLILKLVQVFFPSLQAQSSGLAALRFYTTASGLTTL